MSEQCHYVFIGYRRRAHMVTPYKPGWTLCGLSATVYRFTDPPVGWEPVDAQEVCWRCIDSAAARGIKIPELVASWR